MASYHKPKNTEQDNSSGLTRLKAVAEYFQVSEMTLWRWRQEPTFPQVYKRGQVVLFDIKAIEQWLTVREA